MLSIVIPLFNKAHTIKRTLESILDQVYPSFEVVVVNDGSTDNGVEIIQNFKSDTRIRIIDQPNQGVSVARNNGVSAAIYDYVAFLDADDEWEPEFLLKIKEAIDLFPQAGMYGCSSIHRDMLTGEGQDSTLERYRGKIQLVDFFENPHTMPHTSAMVVAKKVFNQIALNGEGFPANMKVCEDWSCFYRIALLSPFVYVGFPLGVRNNNVSGQTTSAGSAERFKLMKHVVDFYSITYGAWKVSPSPTKSFMPFLKYDLRGRIFSSLQIKDYKTVRYLLENLPAGIKSQLSFGEQFLYKKKTLRFLAIWYIYITKLLWRRHGYPVVGRYK